MRVGSILLLITGLFNALSAQDAARGTSVAGLVLDQTEAGVGGTTITLRRSGKNVATANADAAGAFVVDAVRPGNYEISAHHAGFKPAALTMPESTCGGRMISS